MQISILTPDKEIFQGPIFSVKVPGTLGQFQILENHAPIVSSLNAGEVVVVTSKGEYQFYNQETGQIEAGNTPGKKLTFHITRGFIEVINNKVSLLVQGLQEKN